MQLISPDNWIHLLICYGPIMYPKYSVGSLLLSKSTFHLLQHSPSNHSPPHHHLISSETGWYSPKNCANPSKKKSKNIHNIHIHNIRKHIYIMIIYITYIYTILYIYTYPSKIGKNGIPGFIFRPWLCCTSLGRRCWPYIPFEIHSNWATGFFLENKRETSLDVPDGVSTSMVRINGLFHLLINGVYWGYNPFTPTIDPNFQGPCQEGVIQCHPFLGGLELDANVCWFGRILQNNVLCLGW